MRYVPASMLGGRPHVMVDGSPRPGTRLCLSHWPFTPTPREVSADLSAEIVLRALRTPGLVPDDVGVASIDHYDVDGLVSLALLLQPELARYDAPRLVEAARVGDFGVVRDRDAAKVAFALSTLADPRRTPLDRLRPPRRSSDPLEVCTAATTAALALLPDLLRCPDASLPLWREEMAAFDASQVAKSTGAVTIVEEPAHDLAVVHVDTTRPETLPARWQGAPLHPAAVHSATSCLRVATLAGGRFELRYRYESWVRLVSRRPRPRVDLAPLAAELDAAERGDAHWRFDGAGAISAALHLVGGQPSSLTARYFLEVVHRHLRELDDGPPAWDPYAVAPESR